MALSLSLVVLAVPYLVAAYVASVLFPRSREVVDAVGKWLQIRAFPNAHENEIQLFALLRILFGAILLGRAFFVAVLLTTGELTGLHGAVILIEGLAALALILGVGTQFALIVFVFFSAHSGAAIMGTSNLTNDVGAMLAVFLFLTQSGRAVSIDNLLMTRFSIRAFWLLYSQNPPNSNAVAVFRALGVFSYWCLCVYSLSMHLSEPMWVSGIAGPVLLSHNFLSTYSAFFEAVFANSNPMVMAAKISIWMMMVWYVTVFPFVLLGGWFRKYMILWGIAFFLLTSQILDLSCLAEVEFIFWAALFWPAAWGVGAAAPLLLFYDDGCNLCDRTVRFLVTVDLFNRIVPMPASRSQNELREAGITFDAAMQDLYGFDSSFSRAFSGYDLYVELCRRVAVLWPLLPLLLLGKVFGLGPWVYRGIARRRRALFGECKRAWTPSSRSSLKPERTPCGQVQIAIAAVILFSGAGYFLSMPIHSIGKTGSENHVTRLAQVFGIAPINVFNTVDLRTAEQWYTLESIGFEPGLLPLLRPDGSRRWWHWSDRTYVGGTIPFRRREIGREGCALDREDYVKAQVKRFGTLHLEKTSAPQGTYSFRYRQFHRPLPSSKDLVENRYVIQPATERCSRVFDVTLS